MSLLTRRTAVAALGCSLLARAGAQGRPSGSQPPLRLVVPFTPGTGIDLIARTVGPRLGERLGRAVIVDNRPGASGNIGTEFVVRAAPNGSTLLVSVSTLVMNRSLYPNLPFDPLKDLVPVSLTSWGQLVLVTNPHTAFKTVGDLIAAARRRPGKINYASPGVGTPHHLAMELFKATNGVFLTHIPYRGSAPAVTDLLSGQVDVAFLPIHVALPQIRAGKLVALAIGSDQRHPLLPQVPTLAEAHAGKVNVDMWYGIFAPAGTSPQLVAHLNRELKEILAMPQIRTSFEAQGMDPATDTPEQFKHLVEQDADRWAKLIKTQHIQAQ
ncbi:MAG TPA: tripartite tricarboxylate transporter substrate binding protein [Ramlibacter sp.]|nr:tripartite tricarboxylate transporter substrate binding protein [Ramlibacter sp.]